MTRIIALSDTHGYHDHVRVPPGDILIHSGDFTKADQGRGEFRAFLQWLERQPCARKVLISGNHDSQTETFPTLARQMIADEAPSVTYLRDEEVNIGGLTIWGSPYTPIFFNWFNMRDRGAAIRAHWDLIPTHIDVLVTHGPPKGYGDWSPYDRIHAGDDDLLGAIKRVRPRLHCAGHFHSGYGTRELVHEDGGKTLIVNASCCNEAYAPVNPPHVIDL